MQDPALDGPPMRQIGTLALAPLAARGAWGDGTADCAGQQGDTCVERNPLMNTARLATLSIAAVLLAATGNAAFAQADVAQSALPLASSDVSLIALFLQAHWVVKAVMLGLLACSVWVWAIAIDKMFLYSRTKRAMDRFEQAFWSGASI